MSTIPPNTVTAQDMMEWEHVSKELKRLKSVEMLLRQKIFGGYFPTPVEGVNTVPLANGFNLKGTYKIERKIEVGNLAAMNQQFVEAQIPVVDLVNYEPKLVLSAYRQLTAEQQHLFDNALIIKPGAPSLEIAPPSTKTKSK